MLTLQGAFNKVRKHLLKQMKRAIGKDGRCKYRTGKGLKCAIGCLIPNKYYKKEFDTLNSNLEVFVRPNVPVLKNLDGQFCWELQKLHDRNKPSRWESKLKTFAKRWNLKW